ITKTRPSRKLPHAESGRRVAASGARARSKAVSFSGNCQYEGIMTVKWEADGRLVGMAVTGAALGWFYWPVLADLFSLWSHDPQYSHGYLVPLFSLYLLWRRRHLPGDRPAHPSVAGACLLVG